MQCIRNYGSVLQTYATQKKLESEGFEVQIIDYYRKDSISPKASVEAYLQDNSKWNKDALHRCIFRIWKYPVHRHQFKVFAQFLGKYVSLTDRKYYSNQELIDYPPKADLFCVGSDQMWNTDYNKGIEEPYYLSFINDKSKCFSFSTSIGKDTLSDDELYDLSKRVSNFRLITVREDSAKKILEKGGIKNVEHILDPTLMLTKDEWKRFVKQPSGAKYLLIYQLNKNSVFDRMAIRLAAEKGLEVRRINLVPENSRLPGKSVYLPCVEEFVSLFYYADYIITDSFHGTSFCINFNKTFAVVKPDRFSTRIESVLDLLGLSQRAVSSEDQLLALSDSINYDVANNILENERKKVAQILSRLKE